MANLSDNAISEHEAKAFVLSAIALSVGIFPIAFWFGVFETVFFEHLFFVWVSSTVALAASVFVPPVDALPAFVSWRGRIVLILPTLWLLLEAFTNSAATAAASEEWLLWGLAVGIVVVTLPYLIYVVVLITVPDVDQLRAPILVKALVGCALATAIVGFAIGKNHQLFLTCHDFKVAGSEVPNNCRDPMGHGTAGYFYVPSKRS